MACCCSTPRPTAVSGSASCECWFGAGVLVQCALTLCAVAISETAQERICLLGRRAARLTVWVVVAVRRVAYLGAWGIMVDSLFTPHSM